MIETNAILKEQHEQLKIALLALKPHGYKSYMCHKLKINWAYVVTPDENLLSVSIEYTGNFNVSFIYQESQDNGGSCSCHDVYPSEITLEIITECERYGLTFAQELGTTLYPTPRDFASLVKSIYPPIIPRRALGRGGQVLSPNDAV